MLDLQVACTVLNPMLLCFLGAWVEACDLYERMIDHETLQPNFVTLNSLVVALDNAGQKEFAQSKYEEGRKLKIVNPWKHTRDKDGKSIYGMVSTKRARYLFPHPIIYALTIYETSRIFTDFLQLWRVPQSGV